MLHSEIQPRRFPVQHQQYVGDEYPRTPALCSASPTTGRCQDPKFSLPNALHQMQFELVKNVFIMTGLDWGSPKDLSLQYYHRS